MNEERAERPSISYDRPPSVDEERLSTESARHDLDWLEQEQEQDRLLRDNEDTQKPSIISKMTGKAWSNKRQDDGSAPLESGALLAAEQDSEKRTRRRRRHSRREVIHRIEEGGSRSSTPASDSSDGSSERDREKIGELLAQKKASKKRRVFGFTILHVVIAALFVAIAYGAYQASRTTKTEQQGDKEYLSNGTSLFAPTTILISLDGFRADYLKRGLSSTLSSFVQQGVSPKYMKPSFPSLTFPNHYTLVTGLHPESHGIVANTFWDNKFREEFVYTKKEHSMQPKWWDQNPLWETAERQGVPTAIHMWPGSEAHIGDMDPAYVDKYNGSEILSKKADRIFAFLDKPGPMDDNAREGDPRAEFIAAYVPNVDANGHLYGPNSTEVNNTISEVDGMLAYLFHGLEERNLTDIVNIVIVSDHGMATTDNTRLVQFEDIVDAELIDHVDGWPHYGLRPKDPDTIPAIHNRLLREAANRDGFDVYLRDEDMPERFHFTKNERIALIWIMAHTGWAIVTKEEYDVAKGQRADEVFHPRGIHGYDNEDPLMRAIFVARGPAFPHTPGSRLEPFQNIEVYNIVCDSLKIEPHPNNGTLRLPLKPVGLHGDENDDDPNHIAPPIVIIDIEPVEPVDGIGEPIDSSGAVPHDGGSAEEAPKGWSNAKEAIKAYWQWVKENLQKLAEWRKDHGQPQDAPP